jgi:hypothetical protein
VLLMWTRAIPAALAALLAAMFPSATAQAAAPSPPDLPIRASYQLNEPAGSTVLQDSSGHGLNGVIGSEIGLNGSTHTFGYLKPNTPPPHPEHLDQVANAALNPGTNDYSITFTARWTEPFGNIMQKGQANAAGGRWKIQIPKGIVQCLFQGSLGQAGVGSGTPLNDGQWHTVVCARDATGATMWVDGVRVSHKAGATGTIANKQPFTIGGKSGCDQVTVTCDYFAGEIDSVVIGASVPTSVPSAPRSVSASPGSQSAGVSWTAPTNDGGSVITGYRVTGSPGGRTCTTTGGLSCSVSGLTDGVSYTFTVTATNALGTGPPSAPSNAVVPVTPDTTPPTARVLGRPASVTLDRTTTVSWRGSDAGSGVASYDARYRVATWNGRFGSYVQPVDWQATSSTSASLGPLTPGSTYCIYVRARDVAGNVSAWSAPRCIARALDDRALAASNGWAFRHGPAFYRHTITSGRGQGIRLSLHHRAASRVVVVATTCPTCGTVTVSQGRRLASGVNLRSGRRHNQVLSTVATRVVRSGVIRIRVTSSHASVLIDGLGIVRRP